MAKWVDSTLESMKLHFVSEGLSYTISASVIVGGAWLVMDDGRIIGEGSFDSLLARNGLFARLDAIATSTSVEKSKIEEAGFA
jgi:vacuolar-type H+-ATPase subunit E/Vma4